MLGSPPPVPRALLVAALFLAAAATSRALLGDTLADISKHRGSPTGKPEPIFTPTTKAPKGRHDEPIDDAQGAAAIGAQLYARVKAHSLALYAFGHDRAKQAGMILADTKFEFGTAAAGKLYLIDEVLTPDSSRYWPADGYRPGMSPPSYDKQFVRDHLLALKWDQRPPGPRLPADVIGRTQEKYLAALHNLIG